MTRHICTEKHTVVSSCSNSRRLIAALLTSTAMTVSQGALAQENPAETAPAETDQRVLDTILVTSQKREQAAQDVPVSLTAITGDSLEAAGVTGVSALSQLAAGITVAGSNPGSLNITVRGIGNLSGNFAAGPATGYYLDEAPISAFSAGVPEVAFWDAERVEVLRGPQGTLFGESSMGGTIRVISNKPDSTAFSGRAQIIGASVSEGESGVSGRAMINLPIVEDKLAVRISAGQQQFLGWTDVPDLGVEDANNGEQTDLRAMLRWTPSSALTLDFTYQHQTLDAEDFGASSPGLLLPSELSPLLQPIQTASPRENQYDLFNATASYDLGPATLVASLSQYKQEQSSIADRSAFVTAFFGIPGTVTGAVNALDIDSTIGELRLVSNGDKRLNWTAGIYGKTEERFLNSGFDITLPLAGITNDQSFTSNNTAIDAQAVFGDVEFKLTDRLSVDAGARFYTSEIDQTTRDETTSIIFGTVQGNERLASGDAEKWTTKIGLSYRPADGLLIYGKVSEGFREGGTNYVPPTEPSIPESFDPEEVRAYELGFKSQPTTWMTLNGAIYQNDWENLQLEFVTPSGLFAFQENAGAAQSIGGELELVAQPTTGLVVTAGVSYVDAEIQEDVLNAFNLPVASEGNTIPFSPEWQGSVSATYRFRLTETLESVNTLAYSYRGETFSEPANRIAEKNEAFNNVNLKFGVDADGWSAALFVNNTLDEDVTTSRLRYITALPIVFGNYVQPRTVGIELNKRF